MDPYTIPPICNRPKWHIEIFNIPLHFFLLHTLQLRAKQDPTKWPIAFDEPDPISSPTPSSVGNSDAGYSCNNYSDIGIMVGARHIPASGEDSFQSPSATYLQQPPNSFEPKAVAESMPYAINQLNDNLYIEERNHERLLDQRNPQSEPHMIGGNIAATASHVSPGIAAAAGNLNPNVPEFVPTILPAMMTNCAISEGGFVDTTTKHSNDEGKTCTAF